MNSNNLNRVYALAIDKKTGKWQVGQWINQSLWSVDGKNTRLCNSKDMTRWKNFVEAKEHTSPVELKKGDRVLVENGRGVNIWFFVVYSLPSSDGEFRYLIGI